jgi:hypothetical protein
MRRIVLAGLVITSTATASPARFATVDAQCLGFAAPTSSRVTRVALSAKVSLAVCEARERMRAIALTDYEQSTREMIEAVTPSLELLQDVRANPDVAWQVIALHASASLRMGMAVRVLGGVPALSRNETPELVAVDDLRSEILRERIRHWFDRAHADYLEIDRLVSAHPDLADNPLVATALADTARHLASSVAIR